MALAGGLLSSGCGSEGSAVFFGLDVPGVDLQRAELVGSLVGRAPSVISLFLKLDSHFPRQLFESMRRRKVVPFVTFEPWPSSGRPGQSEWERYSLRAIIDGFHDQGLMKIARDLSAVREPLYFRFAHEMNAWWYPWCEGVNGNRPGEYVLAWHHVREVFQRAGANQVRWVWSPNRVFETRRKLPDIAELYPGDDSIDYAGITGYSQGSKSARETFGQSIEEISRISSKQVVLSEIGANGQYAGRWISSLGSFIRDNRSVVGFVYFDTSPSSTGATGDYEIEGHPSKVAALREVLGQSLRS